MEKAKSKVIVLYGAIAVGKLTVAKALEKELGYKLTHNHLINDLVFSVFGRETIEGNKMVEKLRLEFYEEAAKTGKNFIITHAYANDFISPTGLSDPKYLKILEYRLEKVGAGVLFVHLQANKKTILSRVKNTQRKKYGKLTKVSIMRNYLNTLDFIASAPVKNNIVINNTGLSPQKVAQIIIKHLKK